MFTPSWALPSAIVPVASAPMTFPWTRLSDEPSISMPEPWLPEMTSAAPATVPPIVFPVLASARRCPA